MIWFLIFKLVSLKFFFLVVPNVPIITNVTVSNAYFNSSKRFLLHPEMKWCSKSYLCYRCSHTHNFWSANYLYITLKVSHKFQNLPLLLMFQHHYLWWYAILIVWHPFFFSVPNVPNITIVTRTYICNYMLDILLLR